MKKYKFLLFQAQKKLQLGIFLPKVIFSTSPLALGQLLVLVNLELELCLVYFQNFQNFYRFCIGILPSLVNFCRFSNRCMKTILPYVQFGHFEKIQFKDFSILIWTFKAVYFSFKNIGGTTVGDRQTRGTTRAAARAHSADDVTQQKIGFSKGQNSRQPCVLDIRVFSFKKSLKAIAHKAEEK